MQFVLIAQLLVLVAVANGAPLLITAMLGTRFAQPLDGGAIFLDARPALGPRKTVRGVVGALAATSLAAPLLGLDWTVGATVAVGATAGDLLSSFIKRRLGLAPGSMAPGLDHIPESLFPLLASRLLVPIGWLDIVAGAAAFSIGALVVSRILFRLKLRDTPY
jgi:CDP-2,3-bis-(O-geranylgeranyl)-sn-glycerol synthase